MVTQPGSTAALASIQTFQNISYRADRHPSGWAGPALTQQRQAEETKATTPMDWFNFTVSCLHLAFGGKIDTLWTGYAPPCIHEKFIEN